MSKAHILVVDDNELFRESVVETLRRADHEVESAENGQNGLTKFQEGAFDLVISDMKMPRMSGLELLERVKQLDRDVPFLIITAYGDIETAVDAMKKGAYDFLQKSDNLVRELELAVERTLRFRSLVNENNELRSALRRQWNYIGSGIAMEEIRKLVSTVAQSQSTVLVSGESGTGKELIARSIHYQSPRHSQRFIKVNCAALPEGLIESELFGHEKGAFTGAFKRKLGKFELATGGTLLLDEIGEMSIGVQAKLLRVLQEGEINRVGGDEPISVDVRLVATTNRDLEEEVREGRFREDLYYRLNVFHVHLPPLRERKDDIPALVEHFVQKYNDRNGFSVENVGSEVLDAFSAYDWPGNIRELENAVERAVVLTRSGEVGVDTLHLGKRKETGGADGRFVFEPGITIAQAEKELILRTLEHCGQNRTKAAQVLDISIRTLRNKLHEYNRQSEQREQV